jgi:hypothetical protein
LFMRISILPKREKTLSTTLRTSLVFDTSAVIATSLLRRSESSSRTLRSLRRSCSRQRPTHFLLTWPQPPRVPVPDLFP